MIYTAQITETRPELWTAEIFRDGKRVKTYDGQDKAEAEFLVRSWVKSDGGKIAGAQIEYRPITVDLEKALALSLSHLETVPH